MKKNSSPWVVLWRGLKCVYVRIACFVYIGWSVVVFDERHLRNDCDTKELPSKEQGKSISG